MISKENFDIISQTCWARECNSCTIHIRENPLKPKCIHDNCPQLKKTVYKKQPPLSPEHFANEMAKIHKDYLIDREDEELCHIEMDNLIINMLVDLGYEDGAYIFEHTKKWYA